MYFFFNKMYSSSLKLKNKSMYKTEVRLPTHWQAPADAPGAPETAGPGEGSEGRKRGLLSSGARWREGAALGMHRLEGFESRTGRGRGGSWELRIPGAALLHSVGSGLGFRGTEF